MKEDKKRIGRLLRNARLEKKISLEKASKDTKITQKYLRSIEDEQFSDIPGAVVLKGFIRIYSRYLAIDPEPLIGELSKKPKKAQKEDEPPAKARPSRDLTPLIKAFSFVAALVVAAAVAALMIRSVVSVTVKQADKAFVGSEKITGARDDSLEIQAQVVGKTWLLVICDGKMVFKDIVSEGRSMTWKAKDRLIFKIGNAAGIRLVSGGKTLMEPGSLGQVITKEFSVR